MGAEGERGGGCRSAVWKCGTSGPALPAFTPDLALCSVPAEKVAGVLLLSEVRRKAKLLLFQVILFFF